MNKKVIPRGDYCHNTEWNVCPYWLLKDDLPEQENGYCTYLGKSDWDINEEIGRVELFRGTGESLGWHSAHIYKCGLLWDQVKECGIKL